MENLYPSIQKGLNYWQHTVTCCFIPTYN